MSYFLLTINALSEAEKSDSGNPLFGAVIIFIMAILILCIWFTVKPPRKSRETKLGHQASVEEVWQIILELKSKRKRSFSAFYISEKIQGSNTRQVGQVLLQLVDQGKLERDYGDCVHEEVFLIVYD
ncbi:MAG: hypothetical protein PHO91_01700 [Patescibacteria group bacterium]|nr:hypothetical protein [Patescibacteria group bacterium]